MKYTFPSSETKTVFMTGVTGFIGSHVAAEFINNGYRVMALARQHEDVPPYQRVVSAIRSVDHRVNITGDNLLVVPGPVEDGNTDDWIRHIRKRFSEDIDEVWHLAAIFKIKKQTRDEVERVNVNGVRNVLNLVTRINNHQRPRYFHVSTAYSQGRKADVVAEEMSEYGGNFRSLYDWSKNEGEHLVKEYQQAYRLDSTIMRPSIVVSSPNSGVVNDAAYYAVLETFYTVAKRAEVTMGEDFDGNIGVRFWCEPQACLNLVPIDYVVKGMVLLSNRESLRSNTLKIFNIVNENPPTIDFIRDIMCESLNVTGIETVPKDAFSVEPMTPLEKLVERRIAFQAPYARENTCFSTTNFRREVGLDALSPPIIDADFLRYINKAFIESHERKLYNARGE